MCWDYDSSDGNCWKSGKFALGAILLRMAWKFSQMMCPALVLSIGNCRTLLLVSLDLGWIPLGECAPFSLAKMCPSDSTVRIGRDVSQNDCLGLLGNASEGFP
jgi:hypothetical protein